MLYTYTKRLKVMMMCVLAVLIVTTGWFIYHSANAKPVCNCMFPNSRRYGVIGSGGNCRVVECEVKQASK
jgi:hypothetical protein